MRASRPAFSSAALLALAALLAACAGEAPPPPDPAAAEALALLQAADAGAIDRAFARLAAVPHTAERRFEERDARGSLVAADSAAPAAALANPLAQVLPDDPAYLRADGAEQFAYAVRDTVVNGRPARVVEAARRPGAASEQAVRRARYVLDAASGVVVALAVERASGSVLFDEATRAAVELAPGPGGAALPRRLEAETLVDTPGQPPRRLRQTAVVRWD